jgi:hypothetical protein
MLNMLPKFELVPARHQKDDDERVGEEGEKAEERGEPLLPDEAVRAVETKPPRRFVVRQAGRSRSQQAEQLPLRPVPEAQQRRLAWFHAPSNRRG